MGSIKAAKDFLDVFFGGAFVGGGRRRRVGRDVGPQWRTCERLRARYNFVSGALLSCLLSISYVPLGLSICFEFRRGYIHPDAVDGRDGGDCGGGDLILGGVIFIFVFLDRFSERCSSTSGERRPVL